MGRVVVLPLLRVVLLIESIRRFKLLRCYPKMATSDQASLYPTLKPANPMPGFPSFDRRRPGRQTPSIIEFSGTTWQNDSFPSGSSKSSTKENASSGWMHIAVQTMKKGEAFVCFALFITSFCYRDLQ